MKNRKLPYYLAAVVSLITLAVYLPALRNGFVIWDDDLNIVNNLHIRSLGWALFRWAFSDVSAAAYWQPVTWISHAVDYALWGLNPAGHHLTSILLHAINTFVAVFLIIRLLEAANTPRNPSLSKGYQGDGFSLTLNDRAILIAAGVTGFLFGLHPLHVESVAWVMERKELLCTLFFMLSIMAYISYAAGEGDHGDHKGWGAWHSSALNRRYLLSLVLFALAMASKPMAVTLPMVLLILDWYPLRRARSSRNVMSLLVEKVPFAAISLMVTIVTLIAQKAAGTMPALETVPLSIRMSVAFKSLMIYIRKMAMPFDLIPLYPYPKGVNILSAEYLFAVALALGVTVVCILAAKRQRMWLSLWGSYVITLLPVLGIIQVGHQSMADRFTYLPGLGPFLLTGLAAAWVWERADSLKQRGLIIKGLTAALAVFLCISLSSLTLKQIAIWKNTVTLWSSVIEKEPNRVPLAYVNRGVAFGEAKQTKRALEDFNSAIALEPSAPTAYNNRGKVYMGMGRINEAIRDYTAAIERDPAYYLAYNNRGLSYRETGRTDRALKDYTTAIALSSDYADAYTNRGILYGEAGQLDRAIEDFTAAIRANPYYADAYTSRGLTFEITGKLDRALEDLNIAITLNSSSVEAYLNRGVVLERMGRLDRALEDYGKAIALKPDDYLAYNNRGNALGKKGRFHEAVKDQAKAIALKPDFVKAYLDRGDLYLKMGNTERAVKDIQKACDLGNDAACEALERSQTQ